MSSTYLIIVCRFIKLLFLQISDLSQRTKSKVDSSTALIASFDPAFIQEDRRILAELRSVEIGAAQTRSSVLCKSGTVMALYSFFFLNVYL